MPIAARWRSLERLPAPRHRDAQPGVYELADADRNVIYIGQSARDVPNRVRQHLSRSGCVQELAVYWRYQFSRVPQADEAQLLTEHFARHGTLPRCNTSKPQLRDARRRYAERSRSD